MVVCTRGNSGSVYYREQCVLEGTAQVHASKNIHVRHSRAKMCT